VSLMTSAQAGMGSASHPAWVPRGTWVLLKPPTPLVGLSPNHRGLFLPFFPSQMPKKRLSRRGRRARSPRSLSKGWTLNQPSWAQLHEAFLECWDFQAKHKLADHSVTQLHLLQCLQHLKASGFCSLSTANFFVLDKREGERVLWAKSWWRRYALGYLPATRRSVPKLGHK